jgi:hypothetical protein
VAHSESIPIKQEQKDSSSSSDSDSSSGEEDTKEEVKAEVKNHEKIEVQEEGKVEVKEEPPTIEAMVGGDQSAVGVPASSADAGRAVVGAKRKWTRRPACPDDRCRQCWYVECGTPGGPKHTYNERCSFVKGARGA